MAEIKKMLYRNGKFYPWKSGDVHTDAGMVTEASLKKSKGTVKSHIGNEFKILEPNFLDLMAKIKRGPQIITKKDIGFILTETGITKDSVVLDAGTGSGYLAFFLSQHAKEVISYEIREDFFKIASENQKFLEIKNLKIKNKDVYKGIEEKNLDAVILDLPEPQLAVLHVFNALKEGGFLIAYLPTIVQVEKFIKTARENFTVIKITELLERDWTVEGLVVRPETQMLGHTAFLCLVRKI